MANHHCNKCLVDSHTHIIVVLLTSVFCCQSWFGTVQLVSNEQLQVDLQRNYQVWSASGTGAHMHRTRAINCWHITYTLLDGTQIATQFRNLSRNAGEGMCGCRSSRTDVQLVPTSDRQYELPVFRYLRPHQTLTSLSLPSHTTATNSNTHTQLYIFYTHTLYNSL